jgi:peptidylprolyl isomerase
VSGLSLEVSGETTSGVISIDFRENLAPRHVTQIIELTLDNLYNNVVFHRVIDGFMAQTGDVKYGTNQSDLLLAGTGSSELPNIEAEFSDHDFSRGIVGMARSSDPNSANSQFFIMFDDAPWLVNQYTVFGEVVSGMNIVDSIKKGNPWANGKVSAPADYIASAKPIVSSSNDIFSIDPETGIVTIKDASAFYANDFDNLYISVSDGSFTKFKKITLTFEDVSVDQKILNKIGSDQSITSSIENEYFIATADDNVFSFNLSQSGGTGHDTISKFDAGNDEIDLNYKDGTSIIKTLNIFGDDYFIFENSQNTNSLTIENTTISNVLKLKNISGKTLKIDSSEYTVDPGGVFDVAVKTSVSTVNVDGITSFKTSIKKVSDDSASNPINLSDVLAQLKHIVGLKELKANALQAGDTNNDGTVNLSDVLGNLKHIVGLKEIDTFDLVTDNGFAINSLNSDSNGYLTLVINGDADQSHADWDLS